MRKYSFEVKKSSLSFKVNASHISGKVRRMSKEKTALFSEKDSLP